MKTLSEVVAKMQELTAVSLNASHYSGFLSKRLTLSSSIAVVRPGRGYHIEVTNPSEEMLVFPMVTSSKYVEGTQSEKRRYYAKLGVRLFTDNLLALEKRCASMTIVEPRQPKEFYDQEILRLQSKPSVLASFTQCTLQIRSTGQRQFEIGRSDDGQDFIALRQCLMPDDYLIFLQRGAADYDVFGLPKEMADGADWSGWGANEPADFVVAPPHVRVAGEADAVYSLGVSTEAKIRDVVSAIDRFASNSIIALAGVPGTGKSFVASIAAHRVAGDSSRVREIQFHPSFGYEEFVEGLRIGKDGGVFVEPGIFSEINERALADPGNTYVLLIEEFTRANISSVLGELLTYVEHRERKFTCTYSKNRTSVARNLVLLATYNPIDRSAIEMDAALIRRLRIIDFPPSEEQLQEMLAGSGVPSEVIEALKVMFAECKKNSDYSSLIPFGHGIFFGIKSESPDLYDLWMERIRHFLYRPGLSPNKFAKLIETNYPWRTSSYKLPASSVAAAPAADAASIAAPVAEAPPTGAPPAATP